MTERMTDGITERRKRGAPCLAAFARHGSTFDDLVPQVRVRSVDANLGSSIPVAVRRVIQTSVFWVDASCKSDVLSPEAVAAPAFEGLAEDWR